MTEDLSVIREWCINNHLCIKTVAMFLSRNKVDLVNESRQASVLLNGSPLQVINEFSYLGVLIDSALSFKGYIDHITNKTYGALSTLRKAQVYLLLKTRKLDPWSYLILSTAPQNYINQDKRVQNRAIRTILNRPPVTTSKIRTLLKSLLNHTYTTPLTYKCVNKLPS